MFGKKNKTPMGRIDSLIGAETRIEGDVVFRGGLRVDGEVLGNVRIENGQAGTLVVSEKARIEGDVSVSHLIVNGTIVGPVRVSETLELQASARVTGDVTYAALEMHQGAIVHGNLSHQEAGAHPVELRVAVGQDHRTKV